MSYLPPTEFQDSPYSHLTKTTHTHVCRQCVKTFLRSYASWTHPSMIRRKTIMVDLSVRLPAFDATRPTVSIFDDLLLPGEAKYTAPFTLDFNCSHNIVNRTWLLDICRTTGTRIDIRLFNGFIRPVTLTDPLDDPPVFRKICATYSSRCPILKKLWKWSSS